MLPAASISLLTMNVAPSAAGASMDNIIQNYPGMKWNFVDILAFYQALFLQILVSYIQSLSKTLLFVFPELTLEERGMLLNIRKKKLELLHEISQLKDELTEVNTEIEAMDTEEG